MSIRFSSKEAKERPSRTAELMALFRALETARSSKERLFADPFAVRFLRPSLRMAVQAARVPVAGRVVPWLVDRGWPGARSSGVARTRFIDDAVDEAVQAGIEQIVLLGAGFDARAHRLPALARTRVFELDRAPTLDAKTAALGQRGGVVRAPADFGESSIDDVLRAAGVDFASRVLFVWEGVTNYLTAEDVDRTIRAIGHTAPGSRIVFTYVHRGVLEGNAFHGASRMRATVSGVGEPWTFGFDPGELSAYLAARGLTLDGDVGADDYRARYWGRRVASRLRGYAFYRIATATVVGERESMKE